jgi:UDP-2-acetamido-2-deoxy-ribo-hexuluronate aminotransferase
MQNIQMVDLLGQYNHISSEIDQAVLDVVKSSQYINGPQVRQFTDSLSTYLGGSTVIPCANGTDALQIALMALGLKPGDEVITATFTYVATAEVIALLQLTPVLVDVVPDSFQIDVEAVKKAITPKTKAIIPVHLFGQCADMEPLLKIAKNNNLFVVEDTAQAIGAEYTFSDGRVAKAGTMGDIGCTSFFPSKNLGCYGDGGAIFTNDTELAQTIRQIANHGQSVQYYHDIVGVNSRLDSIQAAILNVKLPHLDAYNKARRKAADMYDEAFANHPLIQTPFRAKNSSHVFHQYTLVLKEGVDRDTLRARLMEDGVPAMIYYPVPLHQQKAYAENKSFPIAESLAMRVISLPMHTELNEESIFYISQTFLRHLESIA